MSVVVSLAEHRAATSPAEPLLAIEDLHVAIGPPGRAAPVIEGMNLEIRRSEIVALVGESGSGKSLTALSATRLLPRAAEITGGRIRFDGENVLAMGPRALDGLRGNRIGMIFQQPQAMLDPTCRVGDQVAESLRRHRGLSRGAAGARVVELFREVGIPAPEARARDFPYAFSGGMAQRVMIAAALSADPDLLIADEPTTALDVTVQAQILRLLHEQCRQRRMSLLLISHDLGIVAALADRVAVMYAGRVIEEGPARAILSAPRHPYTRALVECSLLKRDAGGRLVALPGSAISARELSHGCRFQPRCAIAAQSPHNHDCCSNEPVLACCDGSHKARCWAVKPEPEEAQQ